MAKRFSVNGRETDDFNQALEFLREAHHATKRPAVEEQLEKLRQGDKSVIRAPEGPVVIEGGNS